jgi:hypothetical protein
MTGAGSGVAVGGRLDDGDGDGGIGAPEPEPADAGGAVGDGTLDATSSGLSRSSGGSSSAGSSAVPVDPGPGRVVAPDTPRAIDTTSATAVAPARIVRNGRRLRLGNPARNGSSMNRQLAQAIATDSATSAAGAHPGSTQSAAAGRTSVGQCHR